MTQTAFRIYGDFLWPPLPQTGEDASTVRGRIDIFYVEAAAAPARVACVRWVPATELAQADAPAPKSARADIPYLLAQSDEDLSELFEHPSQPFELRLDAANVAAPRWGRRLAFRGAVIFDQFELSSGAPSRGETLRWLLARRFNQGGRPFLSGVVIGDQRDGIATSGATYAFHFGLPTPGPQAVIEGLATYAVPFRARYLPLFRPPQDDWTSPVPVMEFGAGPEGGLATDDMVPLEKRSLDRKHLGGFGFCRSDGGADYLYFPRSGNRTGTYWLEQERLYFEEVLSRLGHMAPHLRNAIRFAKDVDPPGDSSPGDEGERWHSIGFPRNSRIPSKTSINFRSAIFSDGTRRVTEGDIGLDEVLGQTGVTHFMLRDPTDGTRWVRSEASHLLLDLETEYEISGGDIWKIVDDPSEASIDLRIRIGFVGRVSSDVGEGDLDANPPSSTRITPDHLLTAAIKGMRLARIDLQNIGSGQPQSLLPEFVKLESDGRPLTFAYCTTARARMSSRTMGAAGAVDWLEWGAPRGRQQHWNGAKLCLSLWPHDQWRCIDRTMGVKLRATMRLPSFAYSASEFEASLWHDRGSHDPHAAYACAFRLRKEQGNKIEGRLGGLEFRSASGVLFSTVKPHVPPQRRPTEDENDADYSYWRFGPRPRIDRHWAANTAVRLRLHVEAVSPRGVDLPWGDRTGRARPLLIPVGDGPVQDQGQYLLDVSEQLSGESDRQLIAKLYDHAPAAEVSGQYVVLSERPFSIVKFHSRPLRERGTAETAQVAFYDSDTRGWQFKLVAPTFHYQFPPQSVGESMDKPRRLEIHDPDKATAGGPVAPHLPHQNGVERHHAVEFRLTPSAELWIRPSDVERGYFLPEWASHEIFRQREALGVGAALAAFRGEFLYGLTVGVDVTAETGPARGARVAEIEALLGHPPGPIGASAPEPDLVEQWDRLAAAIARRPERLEFWMREPGSTLPFTPARFAAGVRFALRESAVHNFPVPEARLLEPPVDQNYLKSNRRTRLRAHGLRGGAIWPLESRNVCRALLDAPESKGGTIERVALSPTGGDADQRAEFLNGVLAIISETRNGHVQRHRVEIIGRIAQYWHRAKHVVVYERTTNPSAQFTPEGGIGTRTRRPVLRKVSEYIELLQPERTYPDFAVASPESSAGLRSVRFNSRVINVDSAWSEDVGDFGWTIPLWNRRSARVRPTVYPRPDIVWVTAAEGEGEAPTVAQDTPEPDLLHFFVDLKDGRDDTDQWYSRVGIDCSDLPPPEHSHQPELDDPGEERRKPSVRRIPRGHRRFTLRLNPAARRSVINAERGAEPIYGGLESITFMRSNAVDRESAQFAAVKKAFKDADQGLKESPEATMSGITGALAKFRLAASGNDAAAIDAAAQALIGVLEAPTAQAWSYAGKLADLDKIVKGGPSACTKLVDDFAGSLHRKKLLILDQIRSWQGNAHDHFPTVQDWQDLQITSKARLIEVVADKVGELIDPALEQIQADLGKVGNSVEQAREIVRDFEREGDAVLGRARRKLDEIVATYDFEKPWSAHRLEEFHRRIASVREGIVADIGSFVSEIQTRLATELGDLAQRIAVGLGAYFRKVSAEESELRQKIGAAENAAIAYLRNAAARLADVEPEFNRRIEWLDVKLGEAIQRAPNHVPFLQGLKADLSSLKEALPKLRASLTETADGLAHVGGSLDEAVAHIAKLLKGLLSDVQAVANRAIDGFEDIAEAGLEQLKQELIAAAAAITEYPAAFIDMLPKLGDRPDWIVDRARHQLAAALTTAESVADQAFRLIDDTAGGIQRELTVLKGKLAPDEVLSMLKEHVIEKAVEQAFDAVDFAYYANITEQKLDELRVLVRDLDDDVAHLLEDFDKRANIFFDPIRQEATDVCTRLQAGLDGARKALEEQARQLIAQLGPVAQKIRDALGQLDELKDLANTLGEDVKAIGDGLSESYTAARAYADRVFDTAGNLTSGGLTAVPGNILRGWAAVTSAPALPGLELARERIACYYGELSKYVDTTPVEAWFGRLGDELKAMGLSFPFSKIGTGLIPDDLSRFDIGRVFKNFGGIDLSKLFGGYKLPAGARDAIKLTHAFDKKQFRAWVQIDVDLPMPGRKSLFTIGPFKLDFVNSRMVGVLRLEASKDSQEVEQTGRATFHTDIDAVVSGQSMVTLQKVALNYERTSGLKVDFDPKNIRLNPAFRFIQETLASLFPQELGGLKIVKKDGIPVGVEHEFSMPPISLMAGTSGVSNIQISNRFALIAYPDFVVSDRFALSRPEMPFLFSIFIIGGTGYINIDCEYRPFRNELTVVVEAAAGGSAALGFAVGPVSGSVFVTLSIALSYRKVIGRSGGGLTVSVVLLIAGTVDVAGIVSVYMGLLLRMTYRENGDIDGVGTLSITVRISRWFKIKVRKNVERKLRKGKAHGNSRSVSRTGMFIAGGFDKELERARRMIEARG